MAEEFEAIVDLGDGTEAVITGTSEAAVRADAERMLAEADARRTSANKPDPRTLATPDQILPVAAVTQIDLLKNMGRGGIETLRNIADLSLRAVRTGSEQEQALFEEKNRLLLLARDQADAARENPVLDPALSQGGFEFGRMAPELFAGLGLGALRGMSARIFGETALGGLGAAARDPNAPLQDVLWNTSLGSAFSFGIGSVAELPGVAKTVVMGRIGRSADIRYGKGAYDRIEDPFYLQRSSYNERVPLTLGEQLADPSILSAEAKTVARTGGAKEKFMDRRVQQALQSWDALITTLNPSRVSPANSINAMRSAYASRVQTIRRVASENFVDRLRPAIEKIPGARITANRDIVGGGNIIQADNYLEYLRTHRRLLQETPGEAVPAALNREIQDLEEAGGRMSIGAMQSKLSAFTRELQGSGVVLRDAKGRPPLQQSPKASMNNLMTDLEATANSSEVGSEIADALRTARDRYRNDLVALAELENSAIDKVLGTAAVPGEAAFASKILALEPAHQKQLFSFLDEFAPEQANILRGQLWETTIEGAKTVTTRGDLRVEGIDFKKLSQALAEKSPQELGTLWNVSAAGASKMRNALDVLAAIGRGGSTDAVQGTLKSVVNRAEAGAINLASRNEGFVARLLAGEWTPGAVERWLYTPDGLKALLAIGGRSPDRSTITQAMQVLMTHELTSKQEQEEVLREIEQQQAQEQAQLGAMQAIGGSQ